MEDCCYRAMKCRRIAEEDEASSAAAGSLKRMRPRDSRDIQLVSTDYELPNLHFPEISMDWSRDFAAADSGLSFCSDHHSLASSRSSSSAESCEVVDEQSSKSLNLEAKSSETEIESETESSTCINSKLSNSATTTARDVHGEGDSDGMESRPEKQSRIHRPAAGRKVSNAEIEDFFSAPEKYEQQRFAEKYNFDIAKDVPLEGRYQWVRCKPSGVE